MIGEEKMSTDKYRFDSAKDIENKLLLYIRDAEILAETGRFTGLGAQLDGISTASQLAGEIRALGEIYIEKMKAISKALPVVRGNTISIFGEISETKEIPSKDDSKFLTHCLRQLRENGFVRASDADTYEEIAAKYPGKVFPARVRGSEARRYVRLISGRALKAALNK